MIAVALVVLRDGLRARRRHGHLGDHRVLPHLRRRAAAHGPARGPLRPAAAVHAGHGTGGRDLRARSVCAELRPALRGARLHGSRHGDRLPERRRHGRGAGEAGEREIHAAAGPDPDGEHLGGRRRARGGRPPGEPGRVAGAVPDQRPALAGGDPRGPALRPGGRRPGARPGCRSCCGTRTCRASWPSSAPWCW